MRKLYKIGSMELGVNSIVILVIAIVLMGLILGFIKTKFSQLDNTLVNGEPEPEAPSNLALITLSREVLNAVANKQAVIKVGVYNNKGSQATNVKPSISCYGGTPTATTTPGGLIAKEKTLADQESSIFTVGFNAPKKGSYICSVSATQISATYAVDFLLQVN